MRGVGAHDDRSLTDPIPERQGSRIEELGGSIIRRRCACLGIMQSSGASPDLLVQISYSQVFQNVVTAWAGL
jgi:hypothetical protein